MKFPLKNSEVITRFLGFQMKSKRPKVYQLDGFWLKFPQITLTDLLEIAERASRTGSASQFLKFLVDPIVKFIS